MTDRWQVGLGIASIALALTLLLVWIPHDVQTGLTETLRRKTRIGDGLAPTLSALGLLAVGAALLAGARGAGAARARIDRAGFGFLFALGALLIVSLTLMVSTGPAVVALLNRYGADVGSYRTLRDAVPYKYLGYGAGGFTLVYGLISLVERRLSLRRAALALCAVAALAALYDLPFDDLLLPPNGDQ